MNYDQALEYIHSTKRFSTKPGLARILNLLRLLGDPHRSMKYVHVAGTNGKGSTTAMSASVLGAAGFRTGVFISPFLERFNERISVDGLPIGDEQLAQLATHVREYADSMEGLGLQHPTEFELITAMAFEHWKNAGCDWVALEVGMGGRLDATNVINHPEVSIITSISFDHTHYLGNSLSEIAWEKCGIIKPGAPVVCYGEQPEEARRVIDAVCDERGCEMVQPEMKLLEVLRADSGGTTFNYKGLTVTVPLMGRHQVVNALGVIEAMWLLRKRGHNITDRDITEGIAGTNWVGRLEPVCDNPYTVIDAAHNADAVVALSAAIDTLFANRKIVTVMGILADKDYPSCIPQIAKRSDIFIATTPQSGRALSAGETAEVARTHCKRVEVVDDICDAVDRATELAGDDKMVLICGSLYVAGVAKTHIRAKSGRSTQ